MFFAGAFGISSVIQTSTQSGSDKIERQNQLLEIMIELYKPETIHELLLKRKIR